MCEDYKDGTGKLKGTYSLQLLGLTNYLTL